MAVTATTHLNFNGDAREALEFYRHVFGGRLVIATYGDLGTAPTPADADKVVFGQVIADDGFGVMAYDVPSTSPGTPLGGTSAPSTTREDGVTLTTEPFFISLRGETVDEVAALWDGLVDGAKVVVEFGPAPWAPAAGMLTDRFGVTWSLDVAVPYAAP